MQNQDTYLPPAPPKKRSPWIERGVVLLAVVVAFGLGAVAGENGAQPAPVAAPSPEVRTVTETVETEVTPAACLDALDSAEAIFRYAAQGFGAASRGFTAAGHFDIQGILAASADMGAATKKINGVTPGWKHARDACRRSA